LVGAMRTGVGGHAALEDVSPGHPLEGFIATVVDKGWATGQGRRFRPDTPISRIEAATMIARAKKLSGTKAQFTDISDPFQHQYASAVADAGIANGQGGRFEPSRALSRAEAAKMLAMIL
ncbi:MAG: S-layer homology domain-containing protein, partial [Acidobacteriota bacterium]